MSTNETAVASLFETISRLSPKYHALVNANADEVESVLDQSRRREQLQEKDIAKIFSSWAVLRLSTFSTFCNILF